MSMTYATYRAKRECGPGEIVSQVNAVDECIIGKESIWVRCEKCGTIRRAKRESKNE